MRYMIFDAQEQESYEIALLVPRLDKDAILKHYIDPHIKDKSSVIAFLLDQQGKKTPAAVQKEFLNEHLPVLQELGVKYIVVCDGDYFKTTARVPKAEARLGYLDPLGYRPNGLAYEPHVIYCPNLGMVFREPERAVGKIGQAFTALVQHQNNAYQAPGIDIIHFAAYPASVSEIRHWLVRLLEFQTLTADIEGFSLKHHSAGIGTISFGINRHEGIAFPVDLGPSGSEIRQILAEFFVEAAKRKIRFIWHQANYDLAVLIYQLFMKDLLDREGLLYGLSVMCANFDDSKIIAYLATNSCAGNKLSLKDIAQQFAGNYAVEEIEDITRIPLPELLQYNLVDCLSTWFTVEKYWDKMVQDEQLDLYLTLFKPALIDIIEMQLTGMPINMEKVKEARTKLEQAKADAIARLDSNPKVQGYLLQRKHEWVHSENTRLKKKRVTLADADDKVVFNYNSDPQIREFIYEFLHLPQLDFTKTKLPSTKSKHLDLLVHHTEDQDIHEAIKALHDYADVEILLTTFIPAFENAALGPDGWHYLFGFFNLGGTKSGRLSSSDPNLQNIPANSRYAKLIKACFEAPPGWLFVGLDFSSLEDRISALTTRDPNKLKVYTDGYDGHCLRAYAYFKDQMPDIDPTTVAGINSIEKKYKPLRQKSKNPTFALTYQGTFKTLMKNYNFSLDLAKQCETAYATLYSVSIQYVNSKLDEAMQKGYVTCAFGLRLRTPLLHQTIRGTKYTPYEAEAEGRTAGNALGQSWGLLNTRLGVEFNGRVRASRFRLDIKPCCQIHDAQYHMIRDTMETVLWYNYHLTEGAKWQNHPDIWHPEVKLGGEVDIFYPSWATPMTIPNDATEEVVEGLVQKHLEELGI